MNNSQLIIFNELKDEVDRKAPLEERTRQAFKLVRSHRNWLVTDETESFRLGLLLAIWGGSSDEVRDFSKEVDALQTLAEGHVPVDLPANPVGIMKLWEEAGAK